MVNCATIPASHPARTLHQRVSGTAAAADFEEKILSPLKPLEPRTPCIGICSTTSLGDPICRGCKRFAFEVIHWNSYAEAEKLSVLDRLEKLVVQILSERFLIRDPALLQRRMQQAAVPYDAQRSAYTWLHNLLKKQHRAISTLGEFGVEIREGYTDLGAARLMELADQELLTLCDAHFARYYRVS
jgi:uncharacterized protein